MITVPALRRSTTVTALIVALGAALCASTALAQQQSPTDEELFKGKCSICHSTQRITRLTPEEIRPVLERMRKMNPDWVTQAEGEHIATVMAKILNDPSAIATRTAWTEAAERGGPFTRTRVSAPPGKAVRPAIRRAA
jgi:ABC-type Fe2+-enterobactin transport system substrate-binding protein